VGRGIFVIGLTAGIDGLGIEGLGLGIEGLGLGIEGLGAEIEGLDIEGEDILGAEEPPDLKPPPVGRVRA